MEFKEIRGDLFSLPKEYILAHCISSDFALGAGIAKTFRDRYGIKETLKLAHGKDGSGEPHGAYSWHDKGYCLFVSSEACPWTVANLVTKGRYFQKPTYGTLKEALHDFKTGLLNCYPNVKKVGMPLIGCGLDRLEWENVREIIKNQFADTDIEITVCRL